MQTAHRLIIKIFVLTVTLFVLGTGLRAEESLITGLATGSSPDGFEPQDNTTSGASYLAVNATPVAHSLHNITDEDWFRLSLPGRSANGSLAAIPYTLRFQDVSLPAGASLNVTIFLEGVPLIQLPPAPCTESSDEVLCHNVQEPGEEIVLLTNGFEGLDRFDVRVTLEGSPFTLVEPFDYSISVVRATGANNGIVGNIGTLTDKAKGVDFGKPIAIVAFETGSPIILSPGNDLNYSDIFKIELWRLIERNGQRLTLDVELVDTWMTTQEPFSECIVGGVTLTNVVVLTDENLEGIVLENDQVTYLARVQKKLSLEVIDVNGIREFPFSKTYSSTTIVNLPACLAPQTSGAKNWNLY